MSLFIRGSPFLYGSTMSLVFDRVFFLRELGRRTTKREREQMIDWMNSAIMEAFQQVVECIVYGLFPIRRPDYREFRERGEALRQLISPHVSLSRKKRTLKSIQALLPRLLRERYLQRTIRVERRRNVFGPES